MYNIKKWLYSTLASDSTIRTYTGGTDTDPRVYHHYPPANITLSTTSAYLIYFLVGSGELEDTALFAKEVPEEHYQIDIYSQNNAYVENIFTQVDSLLSENLTATGITGYDVKRIYRVLQQDLYEPEDHIYRKLLQYSFWRIRSTS